MIKFSAGVITTLLIIAVVASGMFGVTNTSPSNELQTPLPSQPVARESTATASADSFEKPQTGFANQDATLQAITTSLQSKNYIGLAPFMTDAVSVTLAASECCGKLSKDQTIAQLSYLNEGTPPWNTSAANPIAKQLITTDPTHFKDAIIAISQNRYVASFQLNDNYIIESIFISADYQLQLGQ